MSVPDPEKYRPCVGIVLFNSEGKVLVGERADGHGGGNLRQFPQGGVDEGENLLAAAFREMKEEIGTDKAEVLEEIGDWLYYEIPQDLLDTLPWGKDYIGQKQRWFAMRFTGTDDDIALDADDHQEFVSYEWIDLADCLNHVVPFKKHVYEILVERFQGLSA